jgi:hypothetical protein
MSAASALAIPLEAIELSSFPYDYEQALAGTDGARGDALVVTASPFDRPSAAAEAALRHRLASIGYQRQSAEAGFLMDAPLAKQRLAHHSTRSSFQRPSTDEMGSPDISDPRIVVYLMEEPSNRGSAQPWPRPDASLRSSPPMWPDIRG